MATTSTVCKWCKCFLSNPNEVELETGICDQCDEEVNGWSNEPVRL